MYNEQLLVLEKIAIIKPNLREQMIDSVSHIIHLEISGQISKIDCKMMLDMYIDGIKKSFLK